MTGVCGGQRTILGPYGAVNRGGGQNASKGVLEFLKKIPPPRVGLGGKEKKF